MIDYTKLTVNPEDFGQIWLCTCVCIFLYHAICRKAHVILSLAAGAIGASSLLAGINTLNSYCYYQQVFKQQGTSPPSISPEVEEVFSRMVYSLDVGINILALCVMCAAVFGLLGSLQIDVFNTKAGEAKTQEKHEESKPSSDDSTGTDTARLQYHANKILRHFGWGDKSISSQDILDVIEAKFSLDEDDT